jgi:hypothetical protein
MPRQPEQAELLVLSNGLARALSHWLLGIAAISIPFLYRENDPKRWWLVGVVAILSVLSVALLTRRVIFNGSFLEVRTALRRVRVHIDQVLSIIWENGSGRLHADIYLESDAGFGNPVSFIGSKVSVLEKFSHQLDLHHNEKARRRRVA